MGRNKANHTRPGMNAAKAQGKGAGYNTEFGNEALSLPNEKLSEAERQNNKRRKSATKAWETDFATAEVRLSSSLTEAADVLKLFQEHFQFVDKPFRSRS